MKVGWSFHRISGRRTRQRRRTDVTPPNSDVDRHKEALKIDLTTLKRQKRDRGSFVFETRFVVDEKQAEPHGASRCRRIASGETP